MQDFDALHSSGAMKDERLWLEGEVAKRVSHLMKRTKHSGADIEHLTDAQYCDLVLQVRHW